MKSIYVLVARDDNTGKITEIKRDTLENIDSYTQDSNREKIIIELLEKGQITSLSQDIYIIKKTNKSISYLEPLFNTTLYNKDLNNLRNSLYESDKKLISTSIINDFIILLKKDPIYYLFVNYELTNIYNRFYDYFKNIQFDMPYLYRQKYRDGNWAITSYELIRNIVESISFYYENLYNNDNAHNELELIREYRKKMKSRRNKSLKEMRIVPDKEYARGQISMFEEDIDIKTLKADEIINELDKIKTTFSRDNLINIKKSNLNYYRELIQRSDKLMIKIMQKYLSSNREDNDKKELLSGLNKNNLIDKAFVFIKLYNIFINSFDKGDINGFSYRKTYS